MTQRIKNVYLAPIQHKDSKKSIKRRDLFKEIIQSNKDLDIVDTPLSADLKIFFSEDLLKLEEDAVQELVRSQLSLIEESSQASVSSGLILDITEFPSNKDFKLAPLLSLCTMCVGFITCIDDLTQEDIYMQTGRLAAIVNDPIELKNFKTPKPEKLKRIRKPNILWFGDSKEIFQVRKEQVQNKVYKIETLLIDKPEVNSAYFKNILDEVDIIYLPKAYDEEGEITRKFKVVFSILEGKFVIAPDCDNNLSFNGTLHEGLEFYRKENIKNWIKMKQDEILVTQGIDKSKEQLYKAIERAEKEDYTELFMSDFEGALEDIEEMANEDFDEDFDDSWLDDDEEPFERM